MQLAISMRSARLASGVRRWHAAAIAAALAVASPSIAGAEVVTSEFNTLANNANQVQVMCAQKVQRNCVRNWLGLVDDSEMPGANDEHHDGPDTPFTDESTDEPWPDFTLWADDIMYRRWMRPVGVGNPVFGGGPPVPSDEGPNPVLGDVPRAPSQDVLSLVVEEEDPGTRAVPEPSSLSLLLASLAVGMGVVARARRRSTQR